MTNPWRDPEHGRRFHGGPTEANPSRPEQIEVLVTLATAHRPRRILDAGCGPGLVAERLLDACPGAELTGFDFSAEMVAAAQARLGGRARIVRASFEEEWRNVAGSGPFDLVVCVQALHHVDDDCKRRNYARFFHVLVPGGLYLQSDPVAMGDERLFPCLKALWNRLRGAAGFPPLPPGYAIDDARRRLAEVGDLLTSLEDQMRWLRDGFDPVDCFWRHGNRAIFGGIR